MIVNSDASSLSAQAAQGKTTLKIDVSPAAIDDKALIQRMMELYQYDLSEFVEGVVAVF